MALSMAFFILITFWKSVMVADAAHWAGALVGGKATEFGVSVAGEPTWELDVEELGVYE